jgi:hypothetical protein
MKFQVLATGARSRAPQVSQPAQFMSPWASQPAQFMKTTDESACAIYLSNFLSFSDTKPVSLDLDTIIIVTGEFVCFWLRLTMLQDLPPTLVAKTGLLTGLLAGEQGWKCPVALLATCCGSKSLKVILIHSDFRAYPVLNPLVTLYWPRLQGSIFPKIQTSFPTKPFAGLSRAPKVGDGGVFRTHCAVRLIFLISYFQVSQESPSSLSRLGWVTFKSLKPWMSRFQVSQDLDEVCMLQ